MPYPEIPQAIRHRVDALRSASATVFQLHKWEDAAAALTNVYDYLKEQQLSYGQRFHKGWELHNRGIALLNIPRFEDGVHSIALAYIEDVISAPLGSEDTADGGLAGSLLPGLGVSSGLLDKIKLVVEARKSRQGIPTDPEEVLAQAQSEAQREISERRGITERAPVLERERRRIEEIESHYHQRCFIGGAYYYGGPNLSGIMRIVTELGFDPIIPDLFEIEENRIHHTCLLLLHMCPKAIFEVTIPGGQYMELERCRDYGVVPLLVRHIRPDGDANQMVSEMVRTVAGVEMVHPYDEVEELRPVIEAYLLQTTPE